MELLEKHFDLAFAAPDGIQKLRELILTLAMQGELVPQDPNDQPASELLKDIEAEKQRLVKEGKSKQPKPLPEIKLEELPYELPPSWRWVRLGEIVSLLGDGIHGTPAYDETGDYFFINGNNLSDGIIEIKENTKRVSIHEYHKYKKGLNSRTVLVSINGTIGNVAFYNNEKVILGKSACYFNLFEQIDKQFTKRLLNSPYFIAYALSSATGSTIKNVSLKAMREFPFSLPPLSEQRRIVAKIDRLMARCDELEKLRSDRNQKRMTIHTAALNHLLIARESNDFSTAWRFITQHFGELYSVKENVAELRKAILQLAVMGKLVPQDPHDEPASELLRAIELEKQQLIKEGKVKAQKPLPKISSEEIPYELPKEWKWVRVIDMVDVGTGSTPATTNSEYYNGDIPWYTSSSTNDSVAEKPEKFITEKAIKETNCKIFPSGSLIIALYGQGKTRGQISEIVIPGATNQAIAAMIFYESSQKTKQYIKYYFIKIYDEIRSLAEGAAQPNLNVGKIKETLIPLPPLAEQRRIVAKIDQLMALCDHLDQQIDAATSKQTTLLNAVMAQV